MKFGREAGFPISRRQGHAGSSPAGLAKKLNTESGRAGEFGLSKPSHIPFSNHLPALPPSSGPTSQLARILKLHKDFLRAGAIGLSLITRGFESRSVQARGPMGEWTKPTNSQPHPLARRQRFPGRGSGSSGKRKRAGSNPAKTVRVLYPGRPLPGILDAPLGPLE